MIPYLNCLTPDDSGITVELFNSISQIPYLDEKKQVPIHQHKFYEMVFIQSGSCRHFYKNETTPLILGDLFLVAPDQPHSYQFGESISIYNCQFYPDFFQEHTAKLIQELSYTRLQELAPLNSRIQDMYNLWEDMEDTAAPSSTVSANINVQGILHLNPQQQLLIRNYFSSMLNEQSEQNEEYKQLKRMYLEILLILLNRIKKKQFNTREETQSWQEEMVATMLNYIENHMADPIDFQKEAEKQHISSSYYRMIFKKITGLSPLEYLSRVRILKALELLQSTYLSVGEVADAVGIHDANYFSRLFKKLVGCPPSYYKSI